MLSDYIFVILRCLYVFNGTINKSTYFYYQAKLVKIKNYLFGVDKSDNIFLYS